MTRYVKDWHSEEERQFYQQGEASVFLCKSAASEPKASMSMSGRLYKSKSDWIMLTVPNAFVRGAFDAMKEPGAQLPQHGDDGTTAHISIMRPEELKDVGGADKVTERGKDFKYGIKGIKSVNPAGWPANSRVWFFEVESPELEKLRKTYGLTPKPNDNKFEFHITFAVRKTSVLGENEKSKAAAVDLDEPTEKVSESQKIPQPQANYRPAETAQNCGACGNFDGASSCSIVDGLIIPEATCDMWEPAQEPSFAGMGAPVKPEGMGSIEFGGIPDVPKMASADIIVTTTAEVLAGWFFGLEKEAVVVAKSAGSKKTVAVDLDGTIAKHFDKYDNDSIPAPRPGAKKALKKFKDNGYRIVVFTVRGNEQLVKDYMNEHDIPFDHVNESPDQPPNSSGKVYAHVYIDDRAVDGMQSWKKIQEQTEKAIEKSAEGPGMEDILRMLIDPAISSWAAENKFVYPGIGTTGTLYEKLRQQQFSGAMMKALAGAADADKPRIMKLIQGISQLSGQKWTPEMQEWAETNLGNIAPIMPILASYPMFNKLTGGRTPLVSAIMSAHQHSGMKPEMANQIADAVMQQVAADPMAFQGMDPSELGQVYYKMWQAGQLPGGADAATITAALKENAPWARAIKDWGENQGLSGNLGQIINQTEQMLGQPIQPGAWTPQDAATGRRTQILNRYGIGQGGLMSMNPERRAQWLATQNILNRQGGDFAAGYRQTGGRKGFGAVNLPQLQQQHAMLMQNAYNSPLATQYGAVMRARDQFKLGPDTPVGRLAAQLEGGNAHPLSRAQLVSAMQQSGVPRDTASSMMNQQFANAEYVGKYNIGNVVRSQQAQVDLQPMLGAHFGGNTAKQLLSPEFGKVIHDPAKRIEYLSRMTGGDRMAAEQLWGRANRLIRYSPLTRQYSGGLSQIHQLFGQPQLAAASKARQVAAEQARTGRDVNPLQSTDLWTRIGAGLRSTADKPGRTLGDFLLGDVIGAVPRGKVEKASPGIKEKFPMAFPPPAPAAPPAAPAAPEIHGPPAPPAWKPPKLGPAEVPSPF